MAGRRGARAGRGWDAIPPRPASDNPSADELRRDDQERGNVPGRRRRSTPSGRSGSGAAGGDAGSREVRGRGRFGSAGGRGEPDWGDRDGRSGRDRDGRSSTWQPQSEAERAREICLRQLAVRPRTRIELAKALARKEISSEVIAEVLDRYDEVGIIDDAAFARAWVSSRHHGRGLARRALANELRQRGVDAEVASEALETIDEDEEATTARALVDRKLRTATGPPDAVFRRLVSMLARKGYPAGVAIRAVKDALAARDAEAAEFADQIDPDALADQADPLS
jgi:regulatory protein